MASLAAHLTLVLPFASETYNFVVWSLAFEMRIVAVPSHAARHPAPQDRAHAGRHGGGRRQVALNWLLRRPTVASVIVGARNEARLLENIGAVGWELTTAQVAVPRRFAWRSSSSATLHRGFVRGTQPRSCRTSRAQRRGAGAR